jgi:hypothetical protein
MIDTVMPSIILGRERFALPIGETRVGGSGDNALPFPALRLLPTVAVLLVTAEKGVSLWPHGHAEDAVTVNGVALGVEPVSVTHGAKIEVAGLRLILSDWRETGTTGPTARITPAQLPQLGIDGSSEPVAEGGRLFLRGTAAAVAIPVSGLVIGRDPDSDLVIAGTEVSRRHAVVRWSTRECALSDVSRNGTFVNGSRVDGTRVLRAGDVIQIGNEKLQFEAGQATNEPTGQPRAFDLATRPAAQRSTEPPTVIRPVAVTRPVPGIWRRLSRFWRT